MRQTNPDKASVLLPSRGRFWDQTAWLFIDRFIPSKIRADDLGGMRRSRLLVSCCLCLILFCTALLPSCLSAVGFLHFSSLALFASILLATLHIIVQYRSESTTWPGTLFCFQLLISTALLFYLLDALALLFFWSALIPAFATFLVGPSLGGLCVVFVLVEFSALFAWRHLLQVDGNFHAFFSRVDPVLAIPSYVGFLLLLFLFSWYIERSRQTTFQALQRSLSELQQRSAELSQSRDVVEEGQQARSALLAGVGHEIRSPLNVIIGLAELLDEEAQESNLKSLSKDLRKIANAGRRLSSILLDLLDLSKIEAGQLTLEPEKIPVRELLESLVESLQPMLDTNDNTLFVEVVNSPETLFLDRQRLMQILNNLLHNACKYTRDGTITFKVDREIENDTYWICFEIRDTGVGMTEEQLEGLFREMASSAPPELRKFAGAGMSLLLCHQLTTLMGGDILVQSEPKVGSTFTLRIPEIRGFSPSLSTQKALPRQEIEQARLLSTTRPQEILLVIDKDPAFRQLLTRSMSKDGLQTVAASEAVAGLRLARELRPNMIFLDVPDNTPECWEPLRSLREADELEGTPILVSSVAPLQEIALSLGAVEFLQKPFTREVLRKTIQSHRSKSPPGRVLLIEDDLDARENMTIILSSRGWQVNAVENGVDALRCLDEQQPSLILLDLVMPQMDGFEFLRTVREQLELGVPIVVITAKELSREEHALINNYTDSILQKGSYNRKQLLHRVHSLLRTPTPPPFSV